MYDQVGRSGENFRTKLTLIRTILAVLIEMRLQFLRRSKRFITNIAFVLKRGTTAAHTTAVAVGTGTRIE